MMFYKCVTCIVLVIMVEGKVRIDPRRNEAILTAPSNEPVTSDASQRAYFEEEISSYMERGPHFAEDSPKKVMAAIGSPAHIPCKVRNLGSKSVSWIRHRDLHVLTVGSFTFTNDNRFSAHRDPSSGDWVLVLRHPLPTDSGKYECSISTKPVTSHTVKLKIVVPSAELLSKTKKIYIDEGSTLNLTCVIQFSPSAPEFVLWYREDKLVDYRVKGRNISVSTIHIRDKTTSTLLVKDATVDDTGKYSCEPSNANIDSVYVHVLKSETPAAMQTTNSNQQRRMPQSLGLTLLSLTVTIFSSIELYFFSSINSVR